MILLSLFWRTSLFVATLYYSFSIHLVFNTLSFFCRLPNCHISPQLPPQLLAHPPSRHHLPNRPVPLLHPVPTADYPSSLRSILLPQYYCFVAPSVNSSLSIQFIPSPIRSSARHRSWSSFILRTHSANASLVFPISLAIPHPLFLLFLYNLAHQSHSYTVLLYLLFAPYRLSLPTY